MVSRHLTKQAAYQLDVVKHAFKKLRDLVFGLLQVLKLVKVATWVD